MKINKTLNFSKKIFSFIFLFNLLHPDGIGQWTQSSTIAASFYNSAVAWEGKVYFAGGIQSISVANQKMQILDLATNQLSYKNLSVGRGGMMTIAHKGKLYFAGGYKWLNNSTAYQMFSEIDVFNTATGEFEPTIHLTIPRGAGIAGVLGDSILFAGGYIFQNGQLQSSDVVEIYDTGTGEWKTMSHLSEPKGDLGAATINGKVYFCGGALNILTGESTNKVDIYDGNIWTEDTISVPRSALSVVAVDKYLLAAGGSSDVGYKYDIVDILNTGTGQWSTAALSAPRCYMAAAVACNKAYFAGGGNCNAATFFLDESSKVVDVFDATTGQLSQFASLNTNRIAHAGAAWENKIAVGAGWRPEQNAFTGSVEIYTVTDDCLSADNSVEKRSGFDFYPNPASEIITIHGTQDNPYWKDADVTISNISGRICLKTTIKSDNSSINVGILPSGIYLIKATAGEKYYLGRLVIIN